MIAEERAFALKPDEAAPNFPEGVVWKLCLTEYDSKPYLKVSCSYCKQTAQFLSIRDLDKVVFKHCDASTENSLAGKSRPSKEQLEQLVQLQIRTGQRKRPNIIDRVADRVPEFVSSSIF
ncbi:MAG: hypothetical protein DMG48_05475 [Acidobacteria bacterium]|nr:MAG: hypothetical protein DMG48_05475 [Acidobacteriota bacterium]